MMKSMKKEVLEIIHKAHSAPKGSYSVYEGLKSEFERINLSPFEYEQACRVLAQTLKV